mmetsp:Transcript_10375/g.29614  ORF Transcript_10375/g.29614 Transcript_10375/m.29614 type:complete len:90 (+) Transcript_10375:757-1026(+)
MEMLDCLSVVCYLEGDGASGEKKPNIRDDRSDDVGNSVIDWLGSFLPPGGGDGKNIAGGPQTGCECGYKCRGSSGAKTAPWTAWTHLKT